MITIGSLSPDFAKNFAANILFAGFTIADNALVRAQNADSKPVENRLQILGAAIAAAAGLADFANRLDYAFAARAVFELDTNRIARLAFNNFVECIPNHSFALLDETRCGTNVVGILVLDEPGMGGPSDRGFENLGKETLFEEDDSNEGWAAQTNVWSSYE